MTYVTLLMALRSMDQVLVLSFVPTIGSIVERSNSPKPSQSNEKDADDERGLLLNLTTSRCY
ncbi:hypothetical protein DERP_006901 [Dermatophagoides pteronyssinus]|uniref:Uncharacterized protein n=1 Tax=Dermatophagoides pteronyssinus TaxID=6956 RepID=A0ABQ8ISC1_DERPT|nr:hypothetical protein DERP_006901 [Dermatophagoides pteronyssinus]